MLLVILLLLTAFLSMLPNINDFPLRGEEATRVVVAYEMAKGGDPFQPTILGDNYFNKPPLFNWMIVGSSYLLGWDIVTGRAVSLFFSLLNALLIGVVVYVFLRDRYLSFISSLSFLVLADVLFWYGWLAEIDITLTFFVSLLFLSIYMFQRETRALYLYFSSFLTGIIFMIKGFPAFAFLGLSLLAVAVYKKDYFLFFRPAVILTLFLSVIFSLWWIPLSEEPQRYLLTLWQESFSRVESSGDLLRFLEHLLTYPLLNFKQLLPLSPLILYLLYKYAKTLTPEIKFLLLLLGFNYIPYIISATSRGRYVLPLFPLVVIFFIWLVKNREGVVRILLFSSFLFIVGRFLYGFVVLPYYDERWGRPLERAKVVHELTEQNKLACDCPAIKDFCLYVGFLRGEALRKTQYTPGWSYVLDCKKREGLVLVEKFRVKKREVYLYSRGESNGFYADSLHFAGGFYLRDSEVSEGVYR